VGVEGEFVGALVSSGTELGVVVRVFEGMNDAIGETLGADSSEVTVNAIVKPLGNTAHREPYAGDTEESCLESGEPERFGPDARIDQQVRIGKGFTKRCYAKPSSESDGDLVGAEGSSEALPVSAVGTVPGEGYVQLLLQAFLDVGQGCEEILSTFERGHAGSEDEAEFVAKRKRGGS
jgi:hypothetical protein